MMKKLRYSVRILILFSIMLSLSVYSFAESFQLTTIGSLDTGGSRYTDWWYTGTSPVLKGTGDPEVLITTMVGDSKYETRSDSSGNWAQWLDLESGDYDIEIKHDENDSYSFTLHLGQSVPAEFGGSGEATQSTTAVPTTGFNQVVGLTLGAGVALLGFYFYVLNDPKHKFAFEKRFIKD